MDYYLGLVNFSNDSHMSLFNCLTFVHVSIAKLVAGLPHKCLRPVAWNIYDAEKRMFCILGVLWSLLLLYGLSYNKNILHAPVKLLEYQTSVVIAGIKAIASAHIVIDVQTDNTTLATEQTTTAAANIVPRELCYVRSNMKASVLSATAGDALGTNTETNSNSDAAGNVMFQLLGLPN